MRRRGRDAHISSGEGGAKPVDSGEAVGPSAVELEKLIGLGERSLRKSYYPELRRKIIELERFQVLLDHAKDFIFLVRLSPLAVVHANHAAAGCHRPEDSLDAMPVEHVLGKGMTQAIRILATSEDTMQFVTLQAALPRCALADLPIEATVSLHELEGVKYALVVARDITDRLLASEESARLRSLLANILDAMPSLLVGVDQQGCILQWNKLAEQETGMQADTVLGQDFAVVLPRLAYLLPDIMTAMRTGENVVVPRSMVQEGGRTRFEHITIFPLVSRDSGNIGGAVLRVDDVTEQARLEQIMIQTEKMMSVGGLAAGMAHEINNPLGGILQGAQNIMRRLSPELPANHDAAAAVGCPLDSVRGYMEERKVFRMLEGIRDSAVRAAEIVRNMLSFARKSESSHSTHCLNEVVDNTVLLASTDYDLKKSFDFRHIRIIREFDSQLPDVNCSRTEIEQVLLNLLRNAAQAMADTEAPAITIRTSQQHAPTGGQAQAYAVIEVEDNGPGMDELTRTRAFEPFFTTKEPGVGTGLGLSVSYFIVAENHGGQMEVDSIPGKGTRFTIRLPIRASFGGQSAEGA